jgi:hypothetical protein
VAHSSYPWLLLTSSCTLYPGKSKTISDHISNRSLIATFEGISNRAGNKKSRIGEYNKMDRAIAPLFRYLSASHVPIKNTPPARTEPLDSIYSDKHFQNFTFPASLLEISSV